MVDKQHIEGLAKKVEGTVKEALGKITGNETLRAEGVADKAAGSTRLAVGDLKDAGRDVASALKR